MTKEEIQQMIKDATENGDIDKISEGVELLKELNKSNEGNFVTTISRKNSNNNTRTRTEPISVSNVNLFVDDGTDAAQDRIKKKDVGRWRAKPREMVKTKVVAECNTCGKNFETHPLTYRKPEVDKETGYYNPNICESCLIKKGRR